MNKETFEQLKQAVALRVTSLYHNHTPEYLVYHNIEHTEFVVKHTMEIVADYSLTEEELFILYTAAWFHDTGQMFNVPALHEEESVRIVNVFFHDEHTIPSYIITAIDECILATKLPQKPQKLIEQILCDADLFHLGTEAFWSINEKVKLEASLRGFNVESWNEKTLKLLQLHQYHTSYCRKKLDIGKRQNIDRLKQQLNIP